MHTNGGEIKDYEGINKSKLPQLPLICVNTTAGTGSELTIFSIITDEERHVKMALVEKNMTPMCAVNDGQNLIARENMAYAECLAGVAFNNTSLGYVHVIAHQLGGFYDSPHGVCNAVLLPRVEKFNAKVCANRLKDVVKFMGIDVSNMNDEEGANACINAIEKLSKAVNISTGLKELGVKEKDFDTLAANVLKDACGLTNSITATHEEVKEILKLSME